MKYMIVAYDRQRGIGANDGLPWQRDLPGDLARFRQFTKGSTVIMGRNTFETIGHALQGRQNIVVTHRPLNVAGVVAAASLVDAYKLADGVIFVIGGGRIYQQALADVDVIYATEVGAVFPSATVFFPLLDAAWYEAEREHHDPDGRDKYPYDFVTYRRG